MADELRHRDKRDPDEAASPGTSGTGKRPFDTSGINWVPKLEEDDPPYRNWWVLERDGE